LIILSLFDGISCGQVALERAGIKVDKYYASEIDKYAIQVTQYHYPNTIQLGNVKKLDVDYIKKLGIDLLLGGSPCQNLSLIGDGMGLDGDQSKLFYEYVKIKNIINPKYFIYENVASMKKEDKNIISNMLGVNPIMIDSALISAQSRKRYYWTNVPSVKQPKDKGILLQDVLEEGIAIRRKSKTVRVGGRNSNDRHEWDLATVDGRRYTPLECERLQTLPDNYTYMIPKTYRYKCLGNCWTVDVITHILSYITKYKYNKE